MTDQAISSDMKRSTIGGAVGNVLEWYDFGVFGYFAPIIGAHFFPSGDKMASLINTFGVFAAGYMMRPIGGMIFGHIGDRMGRKKALMLSVAMMALPTTLLGLLPTHAQIGVAASVLLVLLRLVQGLSVGGELIGSISFVTESAPPERRGFVGSWTLFTAAGGIMLGSAVATLLHGFLSDTALHSWGWRVPFICGIIIGFVGLWMRRGLVETGEFQKVKEAGEIDRNPVAAALKSSPGAILHVASLVVLMGGGFYILFVWWPTYLTKIVQPPIPHALAVNTIGMLFLMALTPVGGWLSDKFGRRPVLLIATAGILVAAYPLFYLTDHGAFFSALGAQMIFALFMSSALGPMPATMVELFPTRTRYSGVAVGYNISLAVFGGTSPLVATWLISKTGDITAPAYYVMAMAVISLIAAFNIKHTHGREPD